MRTWHGSCHCGALGFEYHTALEPAAWPVRACQCSYCRAHGAACTSDPAGSVEFTHEKPKLLSRYRFGHKSADFIFCSRCGSYLGAMTDVSGRTLAVINVNVLDPRPNELPDAQPISYDGETSEARESRRAMRWTPVSRS
jgi:hypothetical protein